MIAYSYSGARTYREYALFVRLKCTRILKDTDDTIKTTFPDGDDLWVSRGTSYLCTTSPVSLISQPQTVVLHYSHNCKGSCGHVGTYVSTGMASVGNRAGSCTSTVHTP